MEQTFIKEIPSGWFAVAFSEDIKKNICYPVTLAQQEYVITRTSDNKILAYSAFCPHLGAHLGYGGKLVDDNIVCPFHALIYNQEGKCLSKGAKHLSLVPKAVDEKWGLVFLYNGNEVKWKLPDLSFEKWFTPKFHIWKQLSIHPENLMENGFDVGHFGPVHHREDTHCKEPLKLDGPFLRGVVVGKGKSRLLGKTKIVHFELDTTFYGLGCYFSEAVVEPYGSKIRLLFFPTPISNKIMDFRLMVCVHESIPAVDQSRIGRLIPKKILLKRITNRVLSEAIFNAEEDFPIWINRTHIRHPPLMANEKEIRSYRQWVKQFYEL